MTETINLCVICGAEWDDHTVRDFREHWGPAHPDLPFEGNELRERQVAMDELCQRVEVTAAVIGIGEAGRAALGTSYVPALRFSFFAGVGSTTVHTHILVLTDERMRALPIMVGDAARAALKQARHAR